MSKYSIFVLMIYTFLACTVAHAKLWKIDDLAPRYYQKIDKYQYNLIDRKQKTTFFSKNSVALQGVASVYGQSSLSSENLSLGGVALGIHSGLGTDAPFIGVFGYHRQPVTFTHTGQQQMVNLGWLGGIEYTDASWGGSFLGIDTNIDAEIFLISAMIGTDFQTESGVLIAGGGLAVHAMTLGVGVELFGIEASRSDEYNGITPTALIAYAFHTSTGRASEGAIVLYARYQGEGIMLGVMLGLLSFK